MRTQQKQFNNRETSNTFNCHLCGSQHERRSCPAYGKNCGHCQKPNHFAKVCQSKRNGFPPVQKAVHNTEENVTDEIQVLNICSLNTRIQVKKKPRRWYVNIPLNTTSIWFKVDTGADCNTLKKEDYDQIVPKPQLLPTNVALRPYMSKQLIFPLGKIIIQHNETQSFDYYVLPAGKKIDNLLCFETCEDLGLIKATHEISVFEANKDLFTGLGKIPGKISLDLDPTVKPVIARCRCFAKSILPRLKNALNTMEKIDVIEKVIKPTPWVSNILAIEKNNAKRDLRVCLDPKALNEAIRIPKYTIPKSEELVAELTGKRIFTVLDMSSGFWHLELDDESASATTFQTPFGQYCFKRMCFGISSAPEIFMRKVAEIFGDIDGCIPYFDDLIIAAETEEEHNKILAKVFERARQYNVRFNPDKLQLKKSDVRFLGLIVSADGVKINPDRIAAIQSFRRPEDSKAVHRFLGMAKFLNAFIPNLSTQTKELRELTKPDVQFEWNAAHETEFNHVKNLITTAPVLRFFDSNLPIVIQTDSSKDGIGCCLMQENQPIAFASRALSRTEQRYSQIEKGLLAIVFAVEKYHYYVYGQEVTIQSDHKPLQTILKKPFEKISARLQRISLRFFGILE